jgi:hypothetical protein
MKKILLLGIFTAFFSCSSDDEGKEDCKYKLWNLTETLATYGETAESAGTVVINQETYDFYMEQVDNNSTVTNGTICWEGTKE